jgi:hypothetical protein
MLMDLAFAYVAAGRNAAPVAAALPNSGLLHGRACRGRSATSLDNGQVIVKRQAVGWQFVSWLRGDCGASTFT